MVNCPGRRGGARHREERHRRYAEAVAASHSGGLQGCRELYAHVNMVSQMTRFGGDAARLDIPATNKAVRSGLAQEPPACMGNQASDVPSRMAFLLYAYWTTFSSSIARGI
jgi:hypothetical protein